MVAPEKVPQKACRVSGLVASPSRQKRLPRSFPPAKTGAIGGAATASVSHHKFPTRMEVASQAFGKVLCSWPRCSCITVP